MPDGRVLIAFADPALDPTPTWTRIDDTANLVAGITIQRGRQTEFDQTGTSTATVFINDTDGRFDPDNPSSPYFGNLDGKQIMLQLRNPVTSAWVTQFRGHISDYGYTFQPATIAGVSILANVAIECVDLFDYLAGVEMQPGVFGELTADIPAPFSKGDIFYPTQSVQERIEFLLTDAGLDSAFFSIFTGNVDVGPNGGTVYDPGDPMLIAIRDAADAEFPGIANVYTDKIGRVVFHGRFARFDPVAVSSQPGSTWDFQQWKAGDGAAITLDPTRAQIRPPLQWSRARSRIINSAIAWPRGITDSDIPFQLVTDATSIAAYGYRSWSAADLIVAEGTTTGFDADTECRLFAEYYVANYKDPRTRVESLSFRSLNPSDSLAAVTWALICGCDISDTIDLAHGYPGGVGVDETFYIDGLSMQIRPLQGDDLDDVELTVNVTPTTYYSDNVFS